MYGWSYAMASMTWKMKTLNSSWIWLIHCKNEVERAFRQANHEQVLIILQNVMIASTVYAIDIFLQAFHKI
jgi:Na+-translocating ferredoxin:NAD+ oxidoreductase RnfE subunit